ncbi:fluoride efflux transporter FluC [Brackiella oedipodis]|uniref:fluoride efflux transporter FluC n=1 Tax=Brackiella oedipodis TaxID=124225 RepID=UPI001FDF1A90|nr:CrcB family protein [Brackiella oedipodis]
MNFAIITPLHILAVASGAALGACARWLLGLALNQPDWPWGTMFANVLGGLLIGLLLSYWQVTQAPPTWLSLFLVTGALGGFTTFSTFSSEVILYFMKGQTLLALLYMASSVIATLCATAVAFYSVQLIAK